MNVCRSDRHHSGRLDALVFAGRIARGALAALLMFGSSPILAQSGAAAPARAGSAGSATSPTSPANVKSITTTLAGSAARTECITVSAQQRLRYWYRAEGAINFAIQYVDVEGKKTLYPVRRNKAAIGSGTFQPKSAQDYCLVWTNPANSAVNLSFEFARVGN